MEQEKDIVALVRALQAENERLTELAQTFDYRANQYLRDKNEMLEDALLRCDGINDNPACFSVNMDVHLAPIVKEILHRRAR